MHVIGRTAPLLVALSLLLTGCGIGENECHDPVESLPSHASTPVTVRVQDHRFAQFHALGTVWQAVYVWSERKDRWVFGAGPQLRDGRYSGQVEYAPLRSRELGYPQLILVDVDDRMYQMSHVLQCPY